MPSGIDFPDTTLLIPCSVFALGSDFPSRMCKMENKGAISKRKN